MFKQNQIIDLPNLAVNHKENLFQVNLGVDDQYYYDLSDTVYLEQEALNPQNYTLHEITRYDNLFTLSQNYYKTRNLWWLIGVANDIDNPFTIRENVGGELKILTPRVVGEILTRIRE